MLWRIITLTLLIGGLAISLVSAQTPQSTSIGESYFSKDFVGTIDKYPIHLHLTREGTALSGHYYYQPQKVIMLSIFSDLFLTGKIDPKGNFTLTEQIITEENKEQQTGKFQGTITATERGLKLSGNWTKQNSSKPLSLTLEEAGSLLPKGLTINAAKMRESNRKLADKVAGLYPQIVGSSDPKILQYNLFVKKHVAKSLADFKKEVLESAVSDPQDLTHVALDITYEISFINENLLSIVFLEETDYGGAHPNHIKSFVNYSLKEGHEITLGQIFKPNTKYEAFLTKLCKQAKTSNLIEITAALESGNVTDWYFDSQGIYINFDIPFAVGGNAEIFIPYKELTSILAPNSPLSELFPVTK